MPEGEYWARIRDMMYGSRQARRSRPMPVDHVYPFMKKAAQALVNKRLDPSPRKRVFPLAVGTDG